MATILLVVEFLDQHVRRCNMLVMLAARLRRARELGGVSARELSRLAGLPSESHVGTLEAASDPNPSANTVTAICRVLGITADYLLTGSGPAPSGRRIRTALDAARSVVHPQG